MHSYSLIEYNNIPVVSMIVPVAVEIEPATNPGVSANGTFRLIWNVSFPSTMSSSITAILTVVLVAPAGIIAVRGVLL